ncbi:MAG: PPC domain-containing DNA-binding protein [Candidatus Bipolaricaulota bacterium]
MNSTRTADRIFVRLDRGEELISSLEDLREEYSITNGFFQGVGAVGKVKLGNYDVENQEYREDEFTGSFEVPSFSGNIGPDKIHAHITVSDSDYSARAGHCSMGLVSGTFEIVILITEDNPLWHQYDAETGLDVFDFSQSG